MGATLLAECPLERLWAVGLLFPDEQFDKLELGPATAPIELFGRIMLSFKGT